MLLYSLFFGFLAWLIPVSVMLIPVRIMPFAFLASLLSSAVSVISEFIDIMRRAYAGDMAGIQDTIWAVILGISVMLAVTALLNTAALIVYNKRKIKAKE